jgi:hypothetical protein
MNCYDSAHKIIESLRRYSWEPGMTHPCERDLASYIELFGGIGVDILQMEALRVGAATYADVIKVLSHSSLVTLEHRRLIVSRGLADEDIQVRDAAITAAENWEGTDLADLLAAHDEKEGWLREYMERVIVNLRSGPSGPCVPGVF